MLNTCRLAHPLAGLISCKLHGHETNVLFRSSQPAAEYSVQCPSAPMAFFDKVATRVHYCSGLVRAALAPRTGPWSRCCPWRRLGSRPPAHHTWLHLRPAMLVPGLRKPHNVLQPAVQHTLVAA